MNRGVNEQVLEKGFAFLPVHRPELTGREVATSFGNLLNLGDGEGVHQLVPQQDTATTPNTYSGIYGHGRFPFHTDLAHWPHPPRYLFLRCLQGFAEVPTLLIDGFQLADRAGRSQLARSLVRPRRPINRSLPLLRIFRGDGHNRGLFRWDETFLVPAGKNGQEGMKRVRESVADSEPVSIELANRGDTLLVDNWRMLHARAPVPPGCETRCIERAYIGEIH